MVSRCEGDASSAEASDPQDLGERELHRYLLQSRQTTQPPRRV